MRLSALTDADLIAMLLMVLLVIIEISLGSPFITQENGDDRLAFLCETDMGGRQVPGTWSEALEILQDNCQFTCDPSFSRCLALQACYHNSTWGKLPDSFTIP